LETLDEYIKLREIRVLSPHWLYQINIYLVNYLEFADYLIFSGKYLNNMGSIIYSKVRK